MRCTVRTPCLERALASGQEAGVWGGTIRLTEDGTRVPVVSPASRGEKTQELADYQPYVDRLERRKPGACR